MSRRTAAPLVLGAAMLIACGVGQDDDEPPTASTAVDSAFTLDGQLVPPALLNGYFAEREGFTSRGGQMRCAYTPLGQEGDRVFIYSLCLEFVRDGDSLAAGSGRGGPVALRIARRAAAAADPVRVVSHEVPADGGGQTASVRRIFPRPVLRRIYAPSGFHAARVDTLQAHLRAEAATRLGIGAPTR